MINIGEIELFRTSISSLKETSKSTHDNSYMTNSELHVVNFDIVKEKYFKPLSVSHIPKSSDALFINSNELFLIEFKAGKFDKKKVFEVRKKIYDSLLLLADILNNGISYTRQNLTYILVYNEGKNPPDTDPWLCSPNGCKNFCAKAKLCAEREPGREQQSFSAFATMSERILKNTGEPFVRFNLVDFRRLYLKNIFTVTETEFEKEFIENWTQKADAFSKMWKM